ncbi:TrmH family RNA methyltransferase [Bifidobacterium pseudolongum]|uniref:rRNA methyltransferase n=1 Tax=Bifidobacterium pseudolongum subsp. globosum TaxID=1690 RepID=A0A4Q5AS33_9BIFI|nr:RNA methyltransferase [Bifidobacterium pseudolongum]MCH4842503.1 RNA methyltransferase [Bifidobacterium pseudolongum]MCH4851315.1 RNA methyltransferase [Bifidobacterium pseudolongum]RYQ35413.1 rRNA methyltransferase [Bifidobacterium pseudolongum subsp. globosum]RYQ37017.1 rRNA methyltransferase [Bifidobacterium pseudolongum subsp. globosum]RYQ38331.1 rRNA methyltransferase [Bifidobacterium pseudolongum subsp. globosum]
MPIDATVMTNVKAERVRRAADLASRKHRERSGRFLIEGPQAVREALTWQPGVVRDLYVAVDGTEPDAGFANPTVASLAGLAMGEGIYVHKATADVVAHISRDAQGVVAVGDLEACRAQLTQSPSTPHPFIAAFWQVRDPGNAGTVIRSADAAGCDAVVMVGSCVDVFNPKVIRATTGSLFHLPVLAMDEDRFFAFCANHATTVMAADVYGTEGRPPESLPDVVREGDALDGSIAVLFGNEARGLEPGLLDRADIITSIPIYGKAESLNLGTSAAVMLMTLAMSSRIERM